jgi:hypothetical protein
MPGPSKDSKAPAIITLTPEMAVQLLEANQNNRPLNHQHVDRIATQITSGKWKFNGDTIKLSTARDILDGQHRLWAVVESKQPIKTAIIYDIEPDAFATIDTLRKPRSGSDVLSMHGVTHHRVVISTALQWLTRYQRKIIETYRAPTNRIENSDIERAFVDNPGIVRAADAASKLRGLTSIGIIAFFYFILTNRNPDLAERMMHSLANPAGIGVNDPFFRLRAHLTSGDRKDPLMTIALMIKAANAAYENREIRVLKWHDQGTNAEPFPKLSVGVASLTPR